MGISLRGVVLSIAVGGILAHGAGPVDEGMAFYQAKDYANALRVWNACAQQGDSACEYQLGLMHQWGKGVAHDTAAAKQWFERAAAKRYAYALYQLGLMYRQGDGVPQDDARALKYYEEGIAIGCNACMEQAGYMYWKGLGTAKNLERAFVLLYGASQRSSWAKDTFDQVAAEMSPEQFERARFAAIAAERAGKPSFWMTWPAFVIYGVVGLVVLSAVVRMVRGVRS